MQTVCSDAKLIDVTASDLDNYPNSAPFTFTIIDEPAGTAKNWIIAYRNGKKIYFELLAVLWSCIGMLHFANYNQTDTLADSHTHTTTTTYKVR